MESTYRSTADIIDDLRIRAAIRRKDTCRGADDRLANQLDEAADRLEQLDALAQDLYE